MWWLTYITLVLLLGRTNTAADVYVCVWAAVTSAMYWGLFTAAAYGVAEPRGESVAFVGFMSRIGYGFAGPSCGALLRLILRLLAPISSSISEVAAYPTNVLVLVLAVASAGSLATDLPLKSQWSRVGIFVVHTMFTMYMANGEMSEHSSL